MPCRQKVLGHKLCWPAKWNMPCISAWMEWPLQQRCSNFLLPQHACPAMESAPTHLLLWLQASPGLWKQPLFTNLGINQKRLSSCIQGTPIWNQLDTKVMGGPSLGSIRPQVATYQVAPNPQFEERCLRVSEFQPSSTLNALVTRASLWLFYTTQFNVCSISDHTLGIVKASLSFTGLEEPRYKPQDD